VKALLLHQHLQIIATCSRNAAQIARNAPHHPTHARSVPSRAREPRMTLRSAEAFL
jgi:hypothetical protein